MELMDLTPNWLTVILTALTSVGGTFFAVKKFIVSNQADIGLSQSQIDVINYLQQVKAHAVESEQHAKQLANELITENQLLKEKINQLNTENKDIRLQNKILSDIITSLQDSLSRTRNILDEQLEINNDLIRQLNLNVDNHAFL